MLFLTNPSENSQFDFIFGHDALCQCKCDWVRTGAVGVLEAALAGAGEGVAHPGAGARRRARLVVQARVRICEQ